eukprot:11551953-Heterocapsa_arctica.AAC.1
MGVPPPKGGDGPSTPLAPYSCVGGRLGGPPETSAGRSVAGKEAGAAVVSRSRAMMALAWAIAA